MRFVYDLTVPADTPARIPAESEIVLVTGTIKRIEIGFPPGCAAMVRVVIKDGLYQMSPASPDTYHAWDDYNEVFNIDYPLKDPHPRLTLMGWSPDTSYQHVITFRFDVTPAGQDDRSALLQLLAGGFKPYGELET